jgi:hypothetical protein
VGLIGAETHRRHHDEQLELGERDRRWNFSHIVTIL